MSLKDYHYEMAHCHRCSYCKFVPFQLMQSQKFSCNCPSIALRHFHSYCSGGRVVLGLGIVEGYINEYTEKMRDSVFECTMCGACQVQCRTYNYNLNPIEVMQELRTHFVEQGELVPEHMMIIEDLKREDNVFGEPKEKRGDWAEGLDVKDVNKEKADVLFHAGCRLSYDDDLWEITRSAVKIMLNAGVDVGIAGKAESCCGGRAQEMGFPGEAKNFADDMASRVNACKATKVVTACADCYGNFKANYPRLDKKLDVEILHITELFDQLIQAGKLEFKNSVPMRVAYHDPCKLGRRSEPGVIWNGEYKRLKPHIFAPIPEKPVKLGIHGCYEAPRNILKAIPGIELVEMERNRVASYCCGAGAGVLEAYEELATATATSRIEEARHVGAEVLVTACPWCERNFKDTVENNKDAYPVYDIIEIMNKSLGGD